MNRTFPQLVIVLYWFAAALQAAPTQHPSDEIPMLAPPLPEIPPTAWEEYGWLLWIAIPVLLAVGAAVVWLALRPGKPPVLATPGAQAKATLLALGAQPEDGATLSHISAALRRYLTMTFWLPPHEMTTREFCSLIAKHEKIGPELAEGVAEFLKTSDARKFAPNVSGPSLRAASKALELVEQAEVRRLGHCNADVRPAALPAGETAAPHR